MSRLRLISAGIRLLFGSALASLLLSAPLLAQSRQLAPTLQPYVSCRSVAGTSLVQTTPLVAAPTKRAVQTLEGDRRIDIADGARLSYTMNGVDYAYMRVEELQAATYLQGRADLVSNFKRLISGDELAFPVDSPPIFRGFEVFGQDHQQMLGSTLGIYMLIDDRTHVAVTIYFQNSDMAHHTFSDMEGYKKLRDAFLNAYTGCVRSPLQF